jgi:methyl-accepting chemotaxis protein
MTNGIIKDMDEAAGGTDKIVKNIASVNQFIKETIETAAAVQSISLQFVEAADDLKYTVKEFKV